MDASLHTQCPHLEALCNRHSIERLSRAAMAVFSSANRPVLGVCSEAVPRCMHQHCSFPASHDLFVCVKCVHVACHRPFHHALHSSHSRDPPTAPTTPPSSTPADYYHGYGSKIAPSTPTNTQSLTTRHKSHLYSHYLDMKQSHNETHAIFLSIDYAHLYCVLCDDFVFNQYLDAAIALHLTRARAYRNKFTTNLSKLDPPVCIEPSSMITVSSPPANSAAATPPPKSKSKSKKRANAALTGTADSVEKDDGSGHTVAKVIKKKPRLQIYGQWINTTEEIRKISANCNIFPNSRTIRGPVGLFNLGNSCYMNSVLQAFLNAPPLRNFFLADLHKQICMRDCKHTQCFACAIERLICDSCFILEARAYAREKGTTSGNNISLLPVPFLVPNHVLDIIWKNVTELAKYEQHDAHEFFIHALNLLNEHSKRKDLPPNLNTNSNLTSPNHTNHSDVDHDLQKSSSMPSPVNSNSNNHPNHQDAPTKPATSIVQGLFQGTLQSDVICRVCGNSSSTPEKFYDVSLHVDKPGSRPVVVSRRGRSSSSSASDGNVGTGAHSGSGRYSGGGVGSSGGSGRSGRHDSKSRTWSPKSDAKDKDSSVNGHSGGGNTDGDGLNSNSAYVNSLRECLNRFTEPEMLDEGCEMHCTSCGCKQESMKQMSIRTLPPIVCFHFKRFKRSFANIRRSEMVKIDTAVEFPADGLDLSHFQTSEILKRRFQQKSAKPPSKIDMQVRENDHSIYDLFAVVNHVGKIDSGHYTAHVRREGVWFRCDDEKVTTVKDIHKVIRSEEAYLVFYVQRCINIQFTNSNYN